MKNVKRIFDYISDIHLDFWIKLGPEDDGFEEEIIDYIVNILRPITKNILVLGGDQGHYFDQDSGFLKILLRYYKHIIIVSGNHDMYLLGNNPDRHKRESNNRIIEMKKFCKETPGLYYLDGDVVTIDNITFGGVGMWHDDSYAQKCNYTEDEIYNCWINQLNDCKYIYSNGDDNFEIPLAYSGKMRIASFDPKKKWLEERGKLNNIKKVDVMITHYGPKIPDNLRSDYKEELITSFYYFDGLSDIERIEPTVWLHGHTHNKNNEKYKNTIIICNPLGYPKDNTYINIIKVEL